MVGAGFRETMRGTFYRLRTPADERAMEFTVDVRIDSLVDFARDKTARIVGDLTMTGFATGRPLAGTLVFHVLEEQRLIYDFTFQADDGNRYRLRGQKDITLLALRESFTTLVATLYDGEGQEVARARLRFDLQADLRSFLRSFRLRL